MRIFKLTVWRPLPCSTLSEDGRCGQQQQPQIQPETAMIYILHVHHHSFRISGFAAATNLPETAESGLYAQQLLAINRVLAQLIPDDWTRTNQAHLAAQDVEKLRQFVEAGTT